MPKQPESVDDPSATYPEYLTVVIEWNADMPGPDAKYGPDSEYDDSMQAQLDARLPLWRRLGVALAAIGALFVFVVGLRHLRSR